MTEPGQLETVEDLENAIAALEAQRAILGDAVVNAAIAGLRGQLDALEQDESAPARVLRGERKLVTILFADIAGFTALAETLDPEAVRDLMNACFNHLVPVVVKYGGTVDKFIGDEIMALFGAPIAHENDPERALRAALEMRAALEAFNAERDIDLAVHFGVNTGLVIAGSIGSAGRQQYSVMGDAVNLAARLEEVSVGGEILVGPDTHRLTAPLFEFETREPVQVKGKAEPVPFYRLLKPRAVPGSSRGIAGLESPLVGRRAEIQALQEAVERLRSSVQGGGIVTLVGEAGLGKSRLMAEVRKQALVSSQGLGMQWIEGRCLSYGQSIAYLLWLDILRGLLGVMVEDPPNVVGEVLRDRVQTLCPERGVQTLPYLARLMTLPTPAEVEGALRGVEGEDLKANTFRAVEILLECTAQQQPLIVVCEDLHWADPTSLELLERLLALTDRVPLLFICVFRPEEEHGCWRIRETAARLYPHRHIDLRLDPLSTVDSKTLVSNLLRVDALPQRFRERILDRAEGNPFYVEEIVRTLIDSEVIVHDEATGHWRTVQDVTDIVIPDTLQGVLVARIDQLQHETKRVLQLAAVIGRIFLYRVLAAIATTLPVAREQRRLDEHLLMLQQEELIRERERVPELEYIFKHHLTQEAAYDSLLKKDRRVFHRRVAEALERSFPERVDEQVGLIAHHWERAEEPEKATEYLLRAGDQARLAYAHQEASDYYQRALVFLREQGDAGHERAARTLMKLGLTYHTAFDFARARQAYEEAFVLWQRVGDAKDRAGTPLPPAPHPFRAVWGEPLTLDPTVAEESYSRAVIEQLFSGLVAEGPELDVVPDVAQSWEVLGGGREYVFRLRDDVHWSDGPPVTADDFAYAWQRVLSSDSPNASLLYDIKGARAFHQGKLSDFDRVGIRVLDPVTLVVELEEPTSYFPSLLTCPVTYPIPRHVAEVKGEAWADVENLVTNGPFKLEDWRPGQSLTAQRNPGYHGQFGGNVWRVELILLADYYAPLRMYESDSVDVLIVSPERKDRAWRRHAEEYVSVPKLQTNYVTFNTSRPPFDDARVRRAFALALDRETLAGMILDGYAFPATGGFVPPGVPGHVAEIQQPYDPSQARRLLAEAGYPGGAGFPIVRALSGRHSWSDVSGYLQTQWQENLGVEIRWEIVGIEAFFARQDEGQSHITLDGWAADCPDPDNFLRVSPMRHNARWRNETYDELVEEARRITNQRKRMELYEQAEGILAEEMAIIPLTYRRLHLLVKPWVAKYPTSAIKTWFWKDIVIEPR